MRQIDDEKLLMSYRFDPNNSRNTHGDVNVTISLNSTSTSPFQNQSSSMSGQLGSRYHTEDALMRRLRPAPSLRAQSRFEACTMITQHTLNLNRAVENNSFGNINFPNNQSYFELTYNNPFAPSSSKTPTTSIYYNCVSSNIHKRSSSHKTIKEPIPNEFFGMYERSLNTKHQSHEISTTIPNYSQNDVNQFTHQRPPYPQSQKNSSQNHSISQSKMALNLAKQSSEKSSHQRHKLLNALPRSSNNPTDSHVYGGESSQCHQNSFHPQSKLPTFPKSHHSTKEMVRQVPFNNVPFSNSQETKYQHSYRWSRSHPYIKYGPYTCPWCKVVFESGQHYSSHIQTHYKNETPSERKERREKKIRKRDLYVTQSVDGLTAMPGTPCVQGEPSHVENVVHKTTKKSNQRIYFDPLIIKEEKNE